MTLSPTQIYQALEAFQKQYGTQNSNERGGTQTFEYAYAWTAWLRAWELATQVAYENAAKCAKKSNFVDGPQGTIEGQIAKAILSLSHQPKASNRDGEKA